MKKHKIKQKLISLLGNRIEWATYMPPSDEKGSADLVQLAPNSIALARPEERIRVFYSLVFSTFHLKSDYFQLQFIFNFLLSRFTKFLNRMIYQVNIYLKNLPKKHIPSGFNIMVSLRWLLCEWMLVRASPRTDPPKPRGITQDLCSKDRSLLSLFQQLQVIYVCLSNVEENPRKHCLSKARKAL